MQKYKTYDTKEELPAELSSNKLVKLIPDQNISIIPEYTLESGVTLTNIPIAWKSWGKLNDRADNCMVICHALTGSADVEDWWGPLMGARRAFDSTKFFIICCNVLGSPYGSASPLTINPETYKPYGPEFPLVSVRDDVRLHRLILDYLGVKQVAICIGGSMGGMQVLEWAQFGKEYVRTIVPIATSGRHSAWGISWGEAQRQSIYSDPNYDDGYYTEENPPNVGLSAARMSALLTYRSRNSFESRFGRKAAGLSKPKVRPQSPGEANRLIHNDGHHEIPPPPSSSAAAVAVVSGEREPEHVTINDPPMPTPFVFSAQSYLRYQGNKFINRFDANCYIALTRKMDSHDLSRGRDEDYHAILASIDQPALVIGIESDGLFTISEQYELAEGMADTEMIVIQSPDGHDGFLLEFDQINRHILTFIKRVLHEIYSASTISEKEAEMEENLKATKTSLFGEAEVDITQW
ncbi:homoserine O-acetyltransferase [Mycotypha africana]|uniref:homoserine O-acetyltransferase n=1 Tax=Mycotypha africana TaxID=64632 RepID=UPI0023002FBF|nr:homoserine O-acetyltransferase [Mycotypha africana]KAI8977355.1 homoserine O-acetyltransferase [Mycotypha africana]